MAIDLIIFVIGEFAATLLAVLQTSVQERLRSKDRSDAGIEVDRPNRCDRDR